VLYVSRGYDTEKQYGHTLHLGEMHFITRNPWGDEVLGEEGIPVTFKNRHTPEFLPGRIRRMLRDEYRTATRFLYKKCYLQLFRYAGRANRSSIRLCRDEKKKRMK
jgi:hypothetical protein